LEAPTLAVSDICPAAGQELLMSPVCGVLSGDTSVGGLRRAFRIQNLEQNLPHPDKPEPSQQAASGLVIRLLG